jgi:hypothetical protein
MKKPIYIFLTFTLLLNSCSFFQSKDELLTKDKWILYYRYISNYENGKSTSEIIFYKRMDEVLTLKFSKDGTIRITEDNGEKFATIRWGWKSDDKKYITLDRGSYTGDFHVLELTNSTLNWSKSDIYSNMTVLETFKHFDDKGWNDDRVDLMNKRSKLMR